MTNINKLIHKYYKPDGKNPTGTPKKAPAERYSNTYQQQQKQKAKLKNRHLLLDSLLNEIPFHINKTQKQEIRYWIDTFNPYWKHFHRQASDETIILAFIMVQAKQADKGLKIERYGITRKYKLTHPVFINIQNQLIFELMRTTPLTYNLSSKYPKQTKTTERL